MRWMVELREPAAVRTSRAAGIRPWDLVTPIGRRSREREEWACAHRRCQGQTDGPLQTALLAGPMKHARLHGARIYNHRELMRLAKNGVGVAVVIREKHALCRVRVIPTQATLALSCERQHFSFNDGPTAGIEGQ